MGEWVKGSSGLPIFFLLPLTAKSASGFLAQMQMAEVKVCAANTCLI